MSKRTPKPATAETIAFSDTVRGVISANAERRSITIGAIGTTAFLSDNPAGTATSGLPILATIQPTTLCACHVGDWVTRTLYVIAAAGLNGQVHIISGFEDSWPNDNGKY